MKANSIKLVSSIVGLLGITSAYADTLIYSDNFSTQNPAWTLSIDGGYVGLLTAQGNLTQSMINNALAGSYANISSGTLNLKANADIGLDWGCSTATLNLQLPNNFRITFAYNKTQWAGQGGLEFIESNPTAHVSYPPQANGRTLGIYQEGTWTDPLYYNPNYLSFTGNGIALPSIAGSNPGQTYNYEVDKIGNHFQVFRDSTLEYDYSGALPLDFTNYLRFYNQQAGSTSQVDNLQIFSVGQVPEPTTTLLFGIGLSVLGFVSLSKNLRSNPNQE